MLYFKNLFYNSYHDIGWSVYDNWIQDSFNEEPICLFGLNTNSDWTIDVVKQRLNLTGSQMILSYNAEPLNPEWHCTPGLINNLRGMDVVWDYSIKNIPILKSVGIDAKYRPTLYTERLKRIQNQKEPDIDILFYGSMTEKRVGFVNDFYAGYTSIDKYVLDKIAKKNPDISDHEFYVWERAVEKLQNISMSWIRGYFTTESLDKVISRSKIVLDLSKEKYSTHRNNSRIFYPLINDKCVLAEYSDERDLFDGCIAEFKDQTEFTNLVYDLIVEDGWRAYQNSGEKFKKRSALVKEKILSEE